LPILWKISGPKGFSGEIGAHFFLNLAKKALTNPPKDRYLSGGLPAKSCLLRVDRPSTLTEKRKQNMKMTTLKAAAAFGLSALLAGSAAAQESASKPVGYETLTVANGFNYLGLRLHEAPVASDAAVAVDGATITVPDGVADALDASTSYLFEVTGGDAAGAVVTVASFDAAADTITVSDAAISDDFFEGEAFTIRPAATLASVFGAANESGLDSGGGGPVGADQVWVPDGAGGFDKFYYDSFNFNSFTATWTNVSTGEAVDGSTVSIVYTDGIILLGSGTDGNTFVVSGSVKLGESSYAFGEGFNYISSVSPAGATLATMFGGSNEAGLAQGNGGPVGADQILVPNGSNFDKYYYDAFNFQSFAPTWTNLDTGAPVDAASVSLDDASGLVVLNPGAAKQVIAGVPSFYSTL
jgi:hypothetical protein